MAVIRAQVDKANPDTLSSLVAALRGMEATLRNARFSGQHPRYRVDDESARQMVRNRWSVVDLLVKATEEAGAHRVEEWCILPPDLNTWLRGAIRSAGHAIEYVGVNPDLNTWRRATVQNGQVDQEDEEARRQVNGIQFIAGHWYERGTWQHFVYQVQSLRVEIESLICEKNKAGVVRHNPKQEARDRWIYKQCCQVTRTLKQIKTKLKQLASKKGWRPIGTIQGIRQRASVYAKRHNLPAPPPRQNL
jgi:hypothetical protein